MKRYVLDTNILIHDPRCIFSFQENEVYIPIYCIEEIDSFKREQSERGRNARAVARHLDELRELGSLSDGVTMPNTGKLFVTHLKKESFGSSDKDMDTKILACALEIKERNKKIPTIFITNDTNLRIRADTYKLKTEIYETNSFPIDELYRGYSEFNTHSDNIQSFYNSKIIPLKEDMHFNPNECIHIRKDSDYTNGGIGRYDPFNHAIKPLVTHKEGVWGIRHRNMEQAFALELLMDDSVKLVTLVGIAGGGKTLLALAAGLQKVSEEQRYDKLIVARPIQPMGKDIGYLPGTIEDKMNPWMQPIFDNIEFLMGLDKKSKQAGRSYQELIDMKILQVEPLMYIRGRTIPKQFMIIDEAQNLSPHEIKTIITRAGIDTKIVLTGDPHQIDNPYIDATNNGLVYVVNKFKDQKIAGHITLSKGERSELAEIAANLL